MSSVSWVEVLEYLQEKRNCETPIHELSTADGPDIGKLALAAATYYSSPENSLDKLKTEVMQGNVYSKIDYALSLRVGFRTPKDEKAAEDLFQEVFDNESAPQTLRARAASHLAALYNRRIQDDPQNSGDAAQVANVVGNANWAIVLGLPSPVVITVAYQWEKLRDLPSPDPNPLAPLWAALEVRKKEIEDEDRERQAKVQRAPNKYRCANPGCTIESLRRGPLMKCAGACDPDVKPYYCTKSCQKAHWKQHKPFCKPGMDGHSEEAFASATITEVSSGPLETDKYMMNASREERELATRSITVPGLGGGGGSLKISSSTITAGGLKSLEAGIDEARRKRGL